MECVRLIVKNFVCKYLSGSHFVQSLLLVGEASGKASKAVAKHIPGSLQDMNARVYSSTSEISKAHKLAVERGDKLSQLEDKAEKMRYDAENFSQTAHELMLKYKEKKWYQL